MQGCTVPEAAAVLHRSKGHVHSLIRNGSLRCVKEKRRYPNKLTRGWSEVEVRIIPSSSIERYLRQHVEDEVPVGRVIHNKAVDQYPDFGKSLNSWHAP